MLAGHTPCDTTLTLKLVQSIQLLSRVLPRGVNQSGNPVDCYDVVYVISLHIVVDILHARDG